MVKENYACAYREVIEILRYTAQEDVDKIPNEKIMLWLDNMNKDYDFKIDPEKTLDEQNISKEAKAILANIFKQYWATEYQKQRIEEKEKYDLEQIEKEKYEKYNPNDLFKKKQQNDEEISVSENVALIEYKESFFTKILNKIKNIFKRK